MEIGSKLKQARLKIELTQEYVAEQIGVSRQTISNWENNKSYPDIVSVIKMSDLYEVSLDYLLKGKEDTTMTSYMDYLEESTNTVKSKQRFSKLIQIGIYMVLWSICLIWFWVAKGLDPAFAMLYSIVSFYMILPITTFIISIQIGKDASWGKYRWAMAFFFGGMQSLISYGTFALANTLAFGNQHFPTIEDGVPGFVVSLLGLLVGEIVKLYQNFKARRKTLNEEKKYDSEAMKTFDLKERQNIFEKYSRREENVNLLEGFIEVDDKTIQLILKKINNTTLVYALAGASGEVCIKFMRNLSGRMLRFVDEHLQSEVFELQKIKEAQIVILQIASTIH